MPTRVLHVVTYMGRGGLETMIMNYYRHIDREKIQFDFLVHRDFEADYDQEILSLGGKIYHISKLVPWSQSYRNNLKHFLKKHPEYQIVHVHQDCLSSVALQCAKECGIPVRIAHSHNSSQDKNWKYFVKRFYMKKIPVYATVLLACSKSAGEWMFQGHSFQVMHNAIDAEIYQISDVNSSDIRRELGLRNEVIIGHIGRFAPQKNHKFLLDVFTECLKIDSNIKLLLVGDGDDKKKIEEEATKLEIKDKVIFAGVRKDIPKLLQVMDVFVFPSLYEGLPVTMIEVQAAGIPCVISDSISEECVITNNLVISRNLEDSKKHWAEIIMEQVYSKRENHIDEIRSAGYDVKIEARRLEKFYLQ